MNLPFHTSLVVTVGSFDSNLKLTFQYKPIDFWKITYMMSASNAFAQTTKQFTQTNGHESPFKSPQRPSASSSARNKKIDAKSSSQQSSSGSSQFVDYNYGDIASHAAAVGYFQTPFGTGRHAPYHPATDGY